MDQALYGHVVWRRSSFCEGNACVEAVRLGNMVAMRDSKQPNGSIITYRPHEWRAFVEKVKNGAFDPLV